jgi:peroxiredoxin
MLGDRSASYTKALGLELNLMARGIGERCQRPSAAKFVPAQWPVSRS